MKNDTLCLCVLGLFLVATLVLGLRPYIPGWQDSLNGSNLGSYNMFVASVDSQERAYLQCSDGTHRAIDHARYFWMNRFVNDTHSRVSRAALNRFAEFLTQREEVRKLATDGGECQVVVELKYRKNGGPWQELRAVKPL
jgi:hypothetical protein